MILFSRWSLLYGILLGTLMILIFHSCICKRKKTIKNAAILYIVLLLLVFFRIIIPIDSDTFYVIRSSHILTTLNDILNLQLYKNISIESLLYIIWIVGAIMSFGRWSYALKRDIQNLNIIKDCSKDISDEYAYIAERVKLDPKRVFISDKIDEVITAGINKYSIILPQIDYSEEDLINIFLHEASHIKHKDILVRIILHAFSCVCWWNPMFKLFESDYAVLMEYRCDENAVKSFTIAEKIRYVETMKKMAIVKADLEYRYMEAGFAIASQNSTIVSRAKRVLEREQTNLKKFAEIIMLELLVFVASYFITIQPFYDPDNVQEAGETKVDRNNAYIMETGNGYRLYIDEEDWGTISNDEIKMEPYCRIVSNNL